MERFAMRGIYMAAVVLALNTTPSLGIAAPLLGGVSSSMGVIEVWKVPLPRKELDRSDYISSCAGIGMKPVCAGGPTCPYHDEHCISLKFGVETENCFDPMQGIAQSLGYFSSDTPHLKHLCAYMGNSKDVDVPIGPSFYRSRKCVKSSVPVTCSSEVDANAFTKYDPDGCEPRKLALELKANGTRVCAEGGVPGLDIGFYDAQGFPCGSGWSMNAVARCRVLSVPDGMCAGAPKPIKANSVMGARYAVCGGYPREQKAAFVSEDGNCPIEGECLTSPHFPNNYVNNGACSLTVLQRGRLVVKHFDTQMSQDVLSVRGATYSGFHGPNGVLVDVGDQIQWTTDGSVTDSGWKICLDNSPHGSDLRSISDLIAPLLLALFVFAPLLLAFIMRRKFRAHGNLVEPLMAADRLSDEEKASIQAMIDPLIFDCSRDGKQFRCIQIAVPGRHALNNQRSVDSEVQVTEFGNWTRIQVTLTKQEDIPKDVHIVVNEAEGTPKLSAVRGAWVWKKTFDFTDGPWVLDDSMSMPSIGGHADIDMHGVIQINLIRTSLPSPKVRKGGVKTDSEPCVRSVESDCMSDIGPSASTSADEHHDKHSQSCMGDIEANFHHVIETDVGPSANTFNDEHHGKHIQNCMGDVEATVHYKIDTDDDDSSIGSFRVT